MDIEKKWDEIDTKLGIVYSNLGICCQDYCDASDALHNLEEVMDLLVDIREKIQINE
jgi:hypothetical protein|tara:strand:+ start:86 stop:256 length:171 start_codon:yes stop_codon:yes gene_type:complete